MEQGPKCWGGKCIAIFATQKQFCKAMVQFFMLFVICMLDRVPLRIGGTILLIVFWTSGVCIEIQQP